MTTMDRMRSEQLAAAHPWLGELALRVLGAALRAANRTLGIVVATYALNVSILLAVVKSQD